MKDLPRTTGERIEQNTLIRERVPDAARRIEYEIGDAKQPDFLPQFKTKHCRICKHILPPRNIRFCSVACRTKVPVVRRHTPDARLKMRAAKLGRTLSVSTRRKLSAALKGRRPKNLSSLNNRGARSHWWKGGITPLNERIRKSLPYRQWREAVFKRDAWTCVLCKQRGGRLNADHIKPFSRFPELRFDINNGRTLCEPCHRKTDTFGWKLHNASHSNI